MADITLTFAPESNRKRISGTGVLHPKDGALTVRKPFGVPGRRRRRGRAGKGKEQGTQSRASRL